MNKTQNIENVLLTLKTVSPEDARFNKCLDILVSMVGVERMIDIVREMFL